MAEQNNEWNQNVNNMKEKLKIETHTQAWNYDCIYIKFWALQ